MGIKEMTESAVMRSDEFSEHSHDEGARSMNISFDFGTNVTLFGYSSRNSGIGYAIVLVCVFAFASFCEFLRHFNQSIGSSSSSSYYGSHSNSNNRVAVARANANAFDEDEFEGLQKSERESGRNFRSFEGTRGQQKRAIMYAAQVSASYLLMLMTMSLNFGVFVSACLGVGFGHYYFVQRSLD